MGRKRQSIRKSPVPWLRYPCLSRSADGPRVLSTGDLRATVRPFGLGSESLDIVTAVDTFECTSDLRPILREIARVLAPGGEIVFTCWNFDRWLKCDLMDRRGPGSVLWSAREVQTQAEESGLAILDIASIFFVPRRLLWWLYRLLLIEPLRRMLVTVSVMLEGRLGSMSQFAMAGRVLVVRAGKIRVTELDYRLR